MWTAHEVTTVFSNVYTQLMSIVELPYYLSFVGSISRSGIPFIAHNGAYFFARAAFHDEVAKYEKLYAKYIISSWPIWLSSYKYYHVIVNYINGPTFSRRP